MNGHVDWLAIPTGTRAERIGLLHMDARRRAGVAPPTTVFLLEIMALGLGSIAGWLGGELVDRLAVGVDDDAHLDAPSSLSGRPAR